MTKTVRLWDWEEDVVRALFYMAPDGEPVFLSLTEATDRAVGHGGIHPTKLEGLAKKLVTLGYGQAVRKEIQVPSIDFEFKLNPVGYGMATELVRSRRYQSPRERLGKIDWSAVAAIISAIAAIASAIFAFQVAK